MIAQPQVLLLEYLASTDNRLTTMCGYTHFCNTRQTCEEGEAMVTDDHSDKGRQIFVNDECE